jgi:hypothetical protein
MSNDIFSPKIVRLWDSVTKYGAVRLATDENVMRRIRFAWSITNSTDTLRKCNIFFLHDNNGYGNAPQYNILHYLGPCVVIKSLKI